jgi:O-antigen ligase
VLVIVFDPRGDVPFDLPKSLASRAIEWAIGAVLILALLQYGRAILPRSRLSAVVAAFAAVSVLAALVAAEPYIAIFGEQDRYLGLTYLADMLVLYVAVAVAVRTARDAATLLGAIAVAGVIAGGYAVVQALGADPFRWAVDPRTRPFATFGNPDQLGHFISVLFGLALGAMIAATRRRRRAVFAAAAAVVLGIAAFVATRGTLLGVGAALATVVAIRRPTRRGSLVGAAAALAIAGTLLVTPLGQRTIAALQAGTLPDRVALYEIAARATLSRPLLGYGPDNFRAGFVTNRTVESLAILDPLPQTSAHNALLDAATTTGLIGLAALLILIALGSVELVGLARAHPEIGWPLLMGWSAYWANSLVDVGSVAVGWFPWAALGIAAALHGDRPVGARRRVPRLVGAAIAIVAIVGAATGARTFVANEESWAAAEASQLGDADAAVVLADRAAARDGGRAENWNRLGLALEAQRRWSDAAAAYRVAASRERYEPLFWANLARALARVALAGQPRAQDEAIAAAGEATVVDPNSPLGHVVLAEIATTFGRCDLARTAAARAAALEAGHADLVSRAAACH